ncbi:carbamate kinase [Jannaschia pohangensis]|uniref:Carbamate kinase n=1 Tax=Jannaschia pohangensis TaxID=390807 RepID=A0A1I3H0H1_9RHOB|nr:carbamate kinase [Jannaschia pohangensis]SFI29244.1 carbamate kinase [Jannaschia pohangensis]
MLVVAALGGNALLKRGEPLTALAQQANVARAARALAGILKAGHGLVVTHGNGPQIGLLAMQTDPWPLDVLGAETDGMIGYVIERELENALDHDRPVATLLTQVLVDPADPAFADPVKFVGPVWTEDEAQARARANGWTVRQDGAGWRRVVPSPPPLDIPDLAAARLLLDHGAVVICGGGGGIPVARGPDGRLTGVEAVVDKDSTSALLARRLGADALLLLTDVAGVMADFGTDRARTILHLTPDEAEAMTLPAGSMAPKVAAAADFARQTGGNAWIGRLEDAVDMLDRRAGTRIGARHGS